MNVKEKDSSTEAGHLGASPRVAFLKWSAIGAIVAVLLIASQAIALDGVEGLLQVGETSPMRPVIETELGKIPLAGDVGHDGQIYYAMALDLDGNQVAQTLQEPAYRYRRILFPAVSGLFGSLGGQALLAGMIVVVVVSAAVATGAMAAIARLLDQSDWLALAVVLNPGIWLSIRLLTAEVLATALMVVGLWAVLVGRRSALVAFSLSVLTKEMFLLTPAGLAVSRDRGRWRTFFVPAGVLVGWTLWVNLSIGGSPGNANALSVPFLGVAESFGWWSIAEVGDRGYFVFSIVSVAAALILGLFSREWLRWSLLCWGILGVCSSVHVWRIGNNAARVFAPILILGTLQVASALRSGTLTMPVLNRRSVRSTET